MRILLIAFQESILHHSMQWIEKTFLEADWHLVIYDGLIAPTLFALVVAATLGAIAWLRDRASYTRRLLPLRRTTLAAWPPSLHMNDVYLAYALISPSSINLPYFMIEEGDVRCIYLMHSLLSDLYGRGKIIASSDQDLASDIHNHENIVVLSGPVWNHTMEFYLGVLGCPVQFDWDADDLKLVASGTEYRSTYVGEHRVKECHGLLVAGRAHVATRDQSVVLVAGCSNLSTYAGGLLLSQLASDKSSRAAIDSARLAKEKSWAIVYKVENWSEYVEQEQPRPMLRSGLRVTVADTFGSSDFRAAFEYHLGPRPSGASETAQAAAMATVLQAASGERSPTAGETAGGQVGKHRQGRSGGVQD